MTGKVAIFRQSISPPRKVFDCKLADASGKSLSARLHHQPARFSELADIWPRPDKIKTVQRHNHAQ